MGYDPAGIWVCQIQEKSLLSVWNSHYGPQTLRTPQWMLRTSKTKFTAGLHKC